ncbi:MAG: DNA mismatch repair endonuclease MutL [Lachnospiraceae bacterium]|nr:DNA mismatch repair endonuclease MutL [Lachnospiraceae bacterium]
MPKIEVLDEQTIDKIAAGEVVERPSSVVKELVENAIDAGSTAVTVEIKDGGTSLIRVTDNGCGIERDQIPVAFYRHSTSKIRQVEDLLTISSLGFRGEALSSIAAVAQVELITKTEDSFFGYRYLIEGGKERSTEEIGAPGGTTVLVKNLFYNTPARRKFLKTPQTEAGHISDMMERIALSHPEISFKFINNGQIRLHTSGNSRLLDVIYQIYGRDITANLIEVSGEFDSFAVSGYIGKPVISRGNRNYETYFVNGRYVKSTLIAKAIEDGYQGFLMQHKYPFAVLLLSLDGNLVDVNVHPNKMELRFSNEQEIYERISDLIRRTLSEKELIADVAVNEESSGKVQPAYDKSKIPEPFETNRRAQTAREPIRYNDRPPASLPDTEPTGQSAPQAPKKSRHASSSYPAADLTEQPRQAELSDYTQESAPFLSEEARPRHRIIGQLFDTYWLVEYDDRFYMIDQHAAHEKVLFEEMMDRWRSDQCDSQMVSPPILLTLSLQEEALLSRYMEDFEKLGYSIDSFGGKEYAVRAVLANLYGLNEKDLLSDLIDELSGVTEKDTPDMVAEKIASMSCKAAVKGNHSMSRTEAEHLIGDLLKLENPYFCPHGRPVIVSMTKQEIEKKFKRIV